jgi:arabinose-5-phosphate isomerase
LTTEIKRSFPRSAKVADILRIESAAIERAAERLDDGSIQTAIELIACCDSKVIVIGVGKSGIIGQKIAQTLTSTGTMAVFVHPSDALHGGLGIVSDDDVVIALSNSGESEEIIAMLPAIARRGPKMIAIVGNTDSTLARKSDVVLDASVDKEACPLNLAPTASTTVALAIGDALAMAVMESKGLTPEAFAANHPAGRLGKRLTVTVGDLMHDSPNVSVNSGWLDVVHAISQFALGAVNVVSDDGSLLGIITDGDLRRTVERTDPALFSELRAEQMMTRGPVTTTTGSLAFDALRLMEDRPSQISVLPVIDQNGRAVGLLRLHDVVRSGI